MLAGLICSAATAGEGSGKITRIHVQDQNTGESVVMFAIENHTKAATSCSGHEWAFNGDTSSGKDMYSLLLSAAAQGKPIIVSGYGDCAAWSDRERPRSISFSY